MFLRGSQLSKKMLGGVLSYGLLRRTGLTLRYSKRFQFIGPRLLLSYL